MVGVGSVGVALKTLQSWQLCTTSPARLCCTRTRSFSRFWVLRAMCRTFSVSRINTLNDSSSCRTRGGPSRLNKGVYHINEM